MSEFKIKYSSMNEFADDYERLGRGAYGTVLKVRDLKNPGVELAVKKIDLDQHIDIACVGKEREVKKANVIKEARVMMEMKHENIVKVHCYFEENNYIFIVMEFCPNGSLKDAISGRKGQKDFFREDQICMWLAQLVLALIYLHDRNILHRDVKAENIFRMDENVLKLGDFGVSTELTHSADLAQTAIGTVTHMSPEALNGDPYSFKHETWSLGIVAYELAALCLPFGIDKVSGVAPCINKIIFGELSELPDGYSPDFCGLINKKMLARNIQQRATMYELAQSPLLMPTVRRLNRKANVKQLEQVEQWKSEVNNRILILEQRDKENCETIAQLREDLEMVLSFVKRASIDVPEISKKPVPEQNSKSASNSSSAKGGSAGLKSIKCRVANIISPKELKNNNNSATFKTYVA